MVHNLMVHEAMPGHCCSSRTPAVPRRTRRAGRVLVGGVRRGLGGVRRGADGRHGYPGKGNPDALRMQQLKMQLRTIINTILDVQLHGELTKAGPWR